MRFTEMRCVCPLFLRIPFELMPAQHQAIAVLIKRLNKARLHRRGRRTEPPVKADAYVATAGLQSDRPPRSAAGLEIKTGEEVPRDLGEIVSGGFRGRRVAQDLGGYAVLHCHRLEGPPQVAMDQTCGPVSELDDAVFAGEVVLDGGNEIFRS